MGCCLVLFLLAATIGCQESKQSLYEEIDHQTHAHWPSDLVDADSNIRLRLDLLALQPSDKIVESELVDLVSWCAEVAADTDLTEQQWLPIYEQTEALRKRLQSDIDLASLTNELAQLSKTLEAAHHSLPTKPAF